jgi:glycosyltransferase involved in cell wall biosynthesis
MTDTGCKGRVLFLAPGDVGKGRVEPISWMQTCNAYADRGLDVTLVSLKVRRPDAVPPTQVWDHFGLQRRFRLVVVPTLLSRDASLWWFRAWAGAAALGVAIYFTASQWMRRPRKLVVHGRLPILVAPFLALRVLLPKARRPRVVFETHAGLRPSHGWVVRRVDLLVTNSAKLADDIASAYGVPVDRVLHVPLGPYNDIQPGDRLEARRELGLSEEATIAVYAGKITDAIYEFLLGTAAIAGRHIDGLQVLIVGGNTAVLDRARRRLGELDLGDTVSLVGFVPPAAVGVYQAAADVLLLYVPSSFPTFQYCTPSKAYEYQAAGRPIVAADIPLFEEVLGEDGERALRVFEHTPDAMADGIVRALSLEDRGRAMAQRAGEWVRERTWSRRAEVILAALDF